jgi:L-ascorbate metabolism protein UlaG (beta-lactamase superfamily)
MKKYIIIFCLILGNLTSLHSQVSHSDLRITYIGSEGFLLTSSTKKVLIDALYSDGCGLFYVPPQKITRLIMDMITPFDNINLFLLTHYHKDHCDPQLISEYLSKHKNIPFVTNKPSIVFIDGNCFGFVLFKKQFYELTPEINQTLSKTINTIPVKAFGLKHLSFYKDSIDLEENMYNESFLFEMDGIRIFHSGDIKKDALQDYCVKNNKWTDTIDVAFLYYELFESGESDLDYVISTLHPKHIVVMHVPPSMNEEWTTKVELLRVNFPNIMFFKSSMDSQTISISGIEDKY